MATFAVILPAAGKSLRFGDRHYKKPFINLSGRAVWIHAAEKFLSRSDCKQVILVIAMEDRDAFTQKFGANAAVLGVQTCEGGAERADSIANALTLVDASIDFVAVHDAARPCIAELWIDAVFDAATKHQAAILATPVSDTLKRIEEHKLVETVARENLWNAQTPQVFARELLVEAYAKRTPPAATDDAELVQRLGKAVYVVEGSPLNIKITTKADLRFAEQALKVLPKPKLGSGGNPFADDDLWR